ncbi:MAG: HAD-IIB family hydrolase [Isosphaeraceae bacterium]
MGSICSLALASDYDGTLAERGRVEPAVVDALVRWKTSGGRLILATGRELAELFQVFPRLVDFDRVVAENGALLYRPECKEERILAAPPPGEFIARLEARGVGPISVGRAIVATWRPHETAVQEVIDELGLDLEVILNKRAVMILPHGVNKASGLRAALDELGLPPGAVVGVGDAENDLPFLSYLRILGRGGQRARFGEGPRRLGHAERPRPGRRRADRAARSRHTSPTLPIPLTRPAILSHLRVDFLLPSPPPP